MQEEKQLASNDKLKRTATSRAQTAKRGGDLRRYHVSSPSATLSTFDVVGSTAEVEAIRLELRDARVRGIGKSPLGTIMGGRGAKNWAMLWLLELPPPPPVFAKSSRVVGPDSPPELCGRSANSRAAESGPPELCGRRVVSAMARLEEEELEDSIFDLCKEPPPPPASARCLVAVLGPRAPGPSSSSSSLPVLMRLSCSSGDS